MAYDRIMEENFLLKKKVKLVKQTVVRKEKIVASYENVIGGLNKKLRDSACDLLYRNKFSDTLKELLKLQTKGTVHQYPDHVKKFALTLNFYSAQAYR